MVRVQDNQKTKPFDYTIRLSEIIANSEICDHNVSHPGYLVHNRYEASKDSLVAC